MQKIIVSLIKHRFMKKFFWVVFAAILSFGFVSCSSSDDDPTEQTSKNKGVYKVVVTQTGELDKFTFSSSINGGDAVKTGVFESGSSNDLGMAYNLTDAEACRNTYSYQTDKNGALLMATVGVYAKEGYENKKITINMKMYLDNKILGEKEDTFSEGVIQINSHDYIN